MTKQEATDAAIERIKGQEVLPGTVVAVMQHPFTMEFIRYDGENALCNDGQGEKVFPKSDIFSVRKCINVANHLLNVGFWAEGMEPTIIEIK